MKNFRSIDDVEAAHLQSLLYGLVKRLYEQLQSAYRDTRYEYNPEEDGFIVLIEEGDTDNAVAAMYGYTLLNAVFEEVHVEDGYFVAYVLHNNQFGITWIIPDALWLDTRLRERLLQERSTQEVMP